MCIILQGNLLDKFAESVEEFTMIICTWPPDDRAAAQPMMEATGQEKSNVQYPSKVKGLRAHPTISWLEICSGGLKKLETDTERQQQSREIFKAKGDTSFFLHLCPIYSGSLLVWCHSKF